MKDISKLKEHIYFVMEGYYLVYVKETEICYAKKIGKKNLILKISNKGAHIYREWFFGRKSAGMKPSTLKNCYLLLIQMGWA